MILSGFAIIKNRLQGTKFDTPLGKKLLIFPSLLIRYPIITSIKSLGMAKLSYLLTANYPGPHRVPLKRTKYAHSAIYPTMSGRSVWMATTVASYASTILPSPHR